MIRTGISGTPVRLGFFARILPLGLALVGNIAAPNGLAQSAQTAPSPGEAHCALHVWPAETTHTTYFGWMHGGAVDGNRRGIKGYPNMYADALDTQQQARLLSQIDWPAQTGDPGLQVSIHPTPTGSDDDRTRTSRLIADAAPCYRELIITTTIVEAAALSSQSVRIVALRKKFDGTGALPVNFSSMSMAKIEVPEKSAPDFDEKMHDAVHKAFLVAVNKFVIMQSFH